MGVHVAQHRVDARDGLKGVLIQGCALSTALLDAQDGARWLLIHTNSLSVEKGTCVQFAQRRVCAMDGARRLLIQTNDLLVGSIEVIRLESNDYRVLGWHTAQSISNIVVRPGPA